MVGYLNVIGWVDGVSAAAIIISAVIFGLVCIIKGFKNNTILLTYAGLTSFCIGSFWLGPFTDFLMVLFFDNAHIYPELLYGLLSYTMVGPGVVFAAVLGGALIAPNYKKVLVAIMLITGGLFEFFLYGFPELTFQKFVAPNVGELLDASFNQGYFSFFLIAFFLAYMLIFMATGFLIKAKQSSGELRRKFIYLAIGFYIFVITGVIDALFTPTVWVGFFRIAMATFAIWLYLGLRP
ncbi:MAG: hypothetical protein ACFFBP_14860 [Promethearchaeota archaeon]